MKPGSTVKQGLSNDEIPAADDKQLAKTIARYGRVDLLMIDELGYMELDRRGAEPSSRLTEREEKNSIAIASASRSPGGPTPSPTPGCVPRSWTGSPTTAPSSKPAPTPTDWRTPAPKRPAEHGSD